MVFERFAGAYPSDGGEASPATAAGCSFGDGILRVFTDDEARRAQSLANEMFPEWAPRIRPFAQDLFNAWREVHADRSPAGAVENLEVVDEAVYWSTHGQLWAKVEIS